MVHLKSLSGFRVCERLRLFNSIARRVDTQEFKDFGICDLRFGVGLVGLFAVGRFVAGGGKYRHTTGAKWV